MKKYILLIGLCIVTVAAIGCGRGKPGDVDTEDVVAKIGSKEITVGEFEERLNALPENIKVVARKNKAAYLDNMIVETLLYDEAVDKGLDRDPEVVALVDEAKKRILIAKLAQEEIEV